MSMRIATAEWADPALVEETYAYRDGTIWLGRSASEHQVPVGYRDDRHVCLVSGSRGGKGTTSIIPTLLTWPGSICIVDPKGENATVTAARRGDGSENCKGLGQAVQVLDPFKAAQVDDSHRGRFNPLDALDPANEETIDEAGRIADAVVVVHESNDPFWDESARAMVKGLILHVLTAPEYEGRRNLITLRKLITRGDWESVEALRAAGEKDIPPAHGLLWTGLANNPAFDGLVAGIGDSFTNMLLNSAKQFESVLQVANRNTEFIDSPAMQRCLEASDFQLPELKTLPQGLSLYLCLPQRYMNTHYRWLRMMISLTVTEMEKVRGKPATGHPVLLVLDEFAGLKRMEVVEHAVAQIAGYGVKMFFVLQSLEQLKGVYKDNWETFLANSGLKVFFNLEDNFSRDYVSKLIGETEVVREVRSASDSVSESESTSHSTSRSQSESVSHSTSRSRSESKGRSSSSGTSETEGTNSSVSTGKSGGVNSSRTKGKTWNIGESWTPTHYLLQALPGRDKIQRSDGKSWTKSETEGESRGWTEGRSDGVSRGTSRSRTDGTSETFGSSVSETDGTTYGTSTSETVGTTHGTSQSRTSGASETIHKRALVTPDEIGQMFARVDDRGRAAYPGLALVVISGARPVALRRVNYYEDYQFLGLFDPHPDHPFTPWREICVEGRELGFTLAELGLRISRWSIKKRQFVAAGDEAATVVNEGSGMPVAWIRVPRVGLIATVHGGGEGDLPQGPLFSLRYYEDGAALLDPFAEVRALRLLKAAPEEVVAEKKRRVPVAVLVSLVGIVILAIIGAIAIIRHQAGSGPPPNDPQAVVDHPPIIPANPPRPEVPAPPVPVHPPVDVRPEAPPAVPSHAPGTPTLARTMEHGDEAVASLAFSPNSRLIASGSMDRQLASGDYVGDTTLWDVATGREIRTLAGHKGVVRSVVFSPDGRVLASGGETIKLWDVASGRELRTLGGDKEYVLSIAFSPDGRVLASGGKTMKLWDVASGRELRTLAGNNDGDGSASSVAFSRDGRMLASGSDDRTIRLWDPDTGIKLRTIAGHKDYVRSVAFSPDGRMLASGSADDTIKLWDVANGNEIRTLAGHEGGVKSVAFSPDGRMLASGSDDHTIKLWDPATGAELGAMAGDKGAPPSVAFSPNGRLLASWGKQIKLWNMTSVR